MDDELQAMFYIIDILYFYFDKYFSKYDDLFKTGEKMESKREIELGNLYTIYEEDEEEDQSESLSKTLLDNIVDDFLLV